MVYIYKFCKQEIQILQPGDPKKQHLGEVRQGRSKSKFNII